MSIFSNAWQKIIQKFKPSESTKPYIDVELATDDRAVYKRFKYQIYTADELLNRKGLKIFNEMILSDPVIESAINSLKVLRLSSGWDVLPASNEKRDIEICDFVKWNLENVEGSFEDDLREIMGALEMGISINELVWRVEEKGKYTGKIKIGNIKSKDPSKFNIYTDDFDNIMENGIINISLFDYGKEYPAEKFIIYSFSKRYENVFGTSRLRSIYDLWFLKQRLIEAWGVYMEKFGNPISMIKVPKEKFENDTIREKLLRIIRQLRFETGMVIPEGIEFEIMKAETSGGNPFESAFRYIDEQMTKVILGQTLTSSQGQVGSYSLGKVHFDILSFYIEQLGRDVADKAINKQLIKRLVDYNFSDIVDYPKFVFKPLVQDDIEKIIDKYYAGVQNGIIKPTPEDEKKIREWLKMPVPVNEESANVFKEPVIKFSDKSKIFSGVRRRTFTAYEEKVPFVDIRDIIETETKDYTIRIGKLIEESVSELYDEIAKKKIVEDKKLSEIDRLHIKYLGDIKKEFYDMLLSVFKNSIRIGKQILSEKKKDLKFQEIDFRKMTPKEVLDWFKQKSYFMTNVEKDNIFKIIKPILLNTIKSGGTIKEFINLATDKMQSYVKLGLIDEEDIYTGNRLETIIRTNVNEAFNFGLRHYYEDPELDGFVEAYQYSAILDDRVRPNHAILDGRIFKVSNPIVEKITPALGYNCRCVLVPIVKGEQWEESKLPANWKPDPGFER